MNRLNSPWTIAAGLVLAVIVWLMTGTGKGSDPQSAAGTPGANARDAVERTTVQVRVQQAEQITRTLRISGRTAPARSMVLKAETDGRVIRVGAPRGERADAGTVIVQLDTRDREARLAEAKASVYERVIKYESTKKMKPDGYVTEGNVAGLFTQVEAARANLLRAELDLEYTRITAPFDGAVAERMVEVGDFITVGDPVAEFIDERTLVVMGHVPEANGATLKAGMPAQAELLDGELLEGSLRYVSPLADTNTRTFQVELEIDNAEGDVAAGVTTRLLIPTEQVQAHKVAPSLLTLNAEGEVGVKLVDADNRVRFHPADIALSQNDAVWLAGLPKQIQLITVGQGYVRDGEWVEVRLELGDDANSAAAGIASGSSL